MTSALQRVQAFVADAEEAYEDGGWGPEPPLADLRLLINVATSAWDLHQQVPSEVDRRVAAPWFVDVWERLGGYLEALDEAEDPS